MTKTTNCRACGGVYITDESEAEAYEQYCSPECQEEAEDHADDAFDYHDDGDDRREFMYPGGNSALRAGPRTESCPTCGQPNRLTKADVNLGYQCDSCADRAEGTYMGADY